MERAKGINKQWLLSVGRHLQWHLVYGWHNHEEWWLEAYQTLQSFLNQRKSLSYKGYVDALPESIRNAYYICRGQDNMGWGPTGDTKLEEIGARGELKI